jgi:hypothetical protein
MANYAGPAVAARPGYILRELITRLRDQPGAGDPARIAASLCPASCRPDS